MVSAGKQADLCQKENAVQTKQKKSEVTNNIPLI